MNTKKVILFDFDGTLCDSWQATFETINALSEEFGYRRIAPQEVAKLRDQPIREVLADLKIPLIRLPSIVLKARKHLRSHVDSLILFPGIENLILGLKKQGYILGILTSNSKENVQKFLEKHQVSVFDFIQGEASLFGKHKMFKKIMKERKIQPEEILYLGDETRDIAAAKAARIEIMSVSWGFNSKEALVREKPNYLVDSPAQALESILFAGSDFQK